MKFSLLILLLMAACSTTNKPQPSKSTSTEVTKVKKEAFSKEKTLTSNEVQDFYSAPVKSQNPALQDETLDRFSIDEIDALTSSNDPMLEITLRCAKKDFNNAFAAASKAFNRYQKIPAYWNAIANCHLQQGSSRKALLFYNKALEVGPNYVPALNNIGVLFSRQGDDQKALVAFDKANKQSRFAKTPRYNLARLYLTYSMADSALPIFQGLLNESPKDVDLINAVANCHFMLSDYSQAISYFGRLPPQLLSRADVGLNYAASLQKSGRGDEAQKILAGVKAPQTREFKEYYSAVAAQLGVQ